jgi:hypothetical protein
MKRYITGMAACSVALTLAAQAGCSSTLLFNPAFVNQQTGDVFPLVPNARTSFVLVRANNVTTSPIEFVLTAERRVPSPADPDTFVLELETRRVITRSSPSANDMGVLFDCPVTRIGLGESLDRPNTEPGIFVGAQAVGAPGFGVPPNVNPLDAAVGNFECGDTIIYVASELASVPGGVIISAFLLDADAQPQAIRGLDTFANARTLIEEQTFEEE